MRYVKPDAGKFARAAGVVVPAGDYVGANMGMVLASVASIISGIGLTIEQSPFFAVLFLIPLIAVAMWTSFAMNTVDIGGYSGDDHANAARELLRKIRGSGNERLAIPLANKIFMHVQYHDWRDDCLTGVCKERTALLAKLVPSEANHNDRSDIDAAKRYVALVSEAEAQHKAALKELGE